MACLDSTLIPAAELGRSDMAPLLPEPKEPLHIDLGTGLGHFIADLAPIHLDTAWIGIESDKEIARRAARRVASTGTPNARVIQMDARTLLREVVAPGSIHHLWINFPDPWPKERHAFRRHTHPLMIRLLLDRLAPGGELHLATDVRPWLREFREAIATYTNAIPLTPEQTPWARSELPVQTKYERKWRHLGKPLWYQDWHKPKDATGLESDLAPQRIDPPMLRFSSPPPALTIDDGGRYLAKIIRPKDPDRKPTRIIFIDRESGIDTVAFVDPETGKPTLQGAWTDWKWKLAERIRSYVEPSMDAATT